MSDWWSADPVAGATEFSAQSKKGDWWENDPVVGEAEGPPKAPVGMAEAIVRGANQGVSLNFGDEAAGLRAASGIPGNFGGIPGAMQAGIGAARMGIDYLTGGSGAQDAYTQAVEAERYRNKQAETERPYSYGGGQIAGAAVLPVGGMMNAATLPVRMARGAAVGAGFGAGSGLGEGDGFVDRAGRATTGAAIGAAIGGVAPPLVEGAIQAGRAVAGPIATAIRGAVNPEAEAARRVAEAARLGVGADPQAVSRLTPQEFAASVQQGGPATLMDIGGESTRALARSAANTSPEARQTLNTAINDRFEGQTNRVVGWLRDTFNYPNADAQQQALTQASRAANNAAYVRAFQQHDGPIWDEALAGLAQDPLMQSAIRRAAVAARTENTMQGYRPMNNPFEFQQSTGNLTLRRDANGRTMYPDLRFWDLVKRELDKSGTRESQSFARTLREHLDTVTRGPDGQSSYAAARRGAAQFFGAENALEAGQNFVTQNFETAATRRALGQMSQQERQLFQDGFVSRFVETLENVSDRRNVLNQIADAPAAREKLNLVLGRNRAAELEAGLRVEGIMDLARGAIQGNSTTVRQLAELGLAGGASAAVGGYGIINQDPQTMTLAAMSAALVAGRRGIDARVARRVAEMLVSDDPQVILRGIRTVARSDRFMDGLRVADRKIASVGAQESPKGFMGIQSISAGRTEEEQPSIGGPRGQ